MGLSQLQSGTCDQYSFSQSELKKTLHKTEESGHLYKVLGLLKTDITPSTGSSGPLINMIW